MKKTIMIGVIAIVWFIPSTIHSQGTIYISNLGQTSVGSDALGSDSWLAMDFITGDNAGGYLLNSVELGMANASGNPSNFAVGLYAANGSTGAVLPGSSLDTFSGSTGPSTAGIYTFTPTSTFTLLPHTIFFIVLTAGTRTGNGAYEWNVATDSYNPSDGWGVGNFFASSGDGSHWQYKRVSPEY